MSALGEQLVHDYLSRLFAAGRGRLTRADCRALVARTGEFIEQSTGSAGSGSAGSGSAGSGSAGSGSASTVSALDVAKFLADLGDPAAIVDAEEARLAAVRGESEPAPDDRRRGLGGVLRPFTGRAKWRWPAHAGSPHLTQSLMAAADDEETLAQDEPVLTGKIILPTDPPSARGPDPDGPLSSDDLDDDMPAEQSGSDNGNSGTEPGPVPVPAEIVELGPRPRWPTVVARNASWLDSVLDDGVLDDGVLEDGVAQDGVPDDGVPDDVAAGDGVADDAAADFGVADDAAPAAEEPPDDDPDEETPGEDAPDEEAPDEDALDGEAPLGARAAVAGWCRLVAGRATMLAVWIADRFRRQPVESVAATLLGIGGAAFPPVWLIGAVVALASRIWDYRDKWLGLALPVLATVVGTVVGVCLTGGASLAHDVHDGWIYADVLSRIAALLGAVYLAWRAAHGRRPPAVPPWAQAHRVS